MTDQESRDILRLAGRPVPEFVNEDTIALASALLEIYRVYHPTITDPWTATIILNETERALFGD